MEELKSSGKPFDISKTEVWDAWIKVKENQGESGCFGGGWAVVGGIREESEEQLVSDLVMPSA